MAIGDQAGEFKSAMASIIMVAPGDQIAVNAKSLAFGQSLGITEDCFAVRQPTRARSEHGL